MTQSKTDPRVIRTRKLIMDSFMKLSSKKEFKDITIKDITAEAKINRVTFYYHFDDIYDLLEKSLSEVFMVNLNQHVFDKHEINRQAIISIFIAMTDFQKTLSNRCHRGYEEIIARIIREQLEILFYKMLITESAVDGQAAKVGAVMLSWGLYGASVEWRKNSAHLSPESFIEPLLPYVLSRLANKPENEC